MNGFDNTSSKPDPATQRPQSMVTEPVPILWEEVPFTDYRARTLRRAYMRKWLTQSVRSWQSVFRRPGHLIPNDRSRLQTR